MANRTQAKAIIDATVTQIKFAIDTYVPVSANITGGHIDFGPTQWAIIITAVDVNEATSLETSITAALTANSVAYITSRERRGRNGQRGVTIASGSNYIQIIY